MAITRAGIDGLPSIINAVILTSATSSGNALLYVGSRYLYALAELGQAPKVFLKCSRRYVRQGSVANNVNADSDTYSGVPYVAVLFTCVFSALTYLSCGSSASTAFTWFQNIATLSGLITWWCVIIASLRFKAALKAQNVPAESLLFRVPWPQTTAIFALIYFSLVIFFNGFYAVSLPFESPRSGLSMANILTARSSFRGVSMIS